MPETISLHLQPRNDRDGRFLRKWGLGNKHKTSFFPGCLSWQGVVYRAWMPERLEGSQPCFSLL